MQQMQPRPGRHKTSARRGGATAAEKGYDVSRGDIFLVTIQFLTCAEKHWEKSSEVGRRGLHAQTRSNEIDQIGLHAQTRSNESLII